MNHPIDINDPLTGVGLGYTLSEVFRMRELLTAIKNARQELADIQGLFPTCSVNRVCEPAATWVAKALNEKEIQWNA